MSPHRGAWWIFRGSEASLLTGIEMGPHLDFISHRVERLLTWLRVEPPCTHRWRVMIENYPSFTKDYWRCTKCNKWQVFENSEPPVKLKQEICNLGHIHIVN